MQTITSGLRKLASLRVVTLLLLLLIVSNILINGKPYGLAQLSEISHGATIPDMEMSGYSPQRAYDILTAQGDAGRAFYLHVIVPQDFPFPLLYSLFFATALIGLVQVLFPHNPRLQQIGLIGLCAGLADWLENLCLIVLLLRYPQRLDSVAVLASVFTITKAILMMMSVVAILIGLALVLAKCARGLVGRYHAKRSPPNARRSR
jgi:hypothetical protein